MPTEFVYTSVVAVGALGISLFGCSSDSETTTPQDPQQQSTGGAVGNTGVCPVGQQWCVDRCVSTPTDTNNCGQCGTVCSIGNTCQAGVCGCAPPLSACSGQCVNLQSDGNNCGGCGVLCQPPQLCSAGECGTACSIPGQVQCGSSCVDTATDSSNCGGCGVACSVGQSCMNGACACPTGQQICTGLCSDPLTDSANCGTCGNVCRAGRTCSGGVCPRGGPGTGGASNQGTGGASAGGNTGGAANDATGGASAGGVEDNPTGGASTGGVEDNPTGGASTGGEGTGGEGTGGETSASCDTEEEEKFSFFLISYEAIQRESGSRDGFGGDLGGLDGADAICQRVAEYSTPCAANKQWRAFLSTSSVDAIDRIGSGPWYDRAGRLLANQISELQNERPSNADSEIINDLPNEYGVPNQNPDGTGDVDNHHFLTGSNGQGRLYDSSATCEDWTSTVKDSNMRPRCGFSWPAGGRSHWIDGQSEGGCLPGTQLQQSGGSDPNVGTVGSGGGYGGWYCFAVIE